jgi:hypothetical protein
VPITALVYTHPYIYCIYTVFHKKVYLEIRYCPSCLYEQFFPSHFYHSTQFDLCTGLIWAHVSGRQTPGFNPGFTPRICYIKGGVNPGLDPGLDVLRFGLRFAFLRVFITVCRCIHCSYIYTVNVDKSIIGYLVCNTE